MLRFGDIVKCIVLVAQFTTFLFPSYKQLKVTAHLYTLSLLKTCLASPYICYDWSSQMVAPAVELQHYYSLRPNLSTMPNPTVMPAITQLLLGAQFVQHNQLHHDARYPNLSLGPSFSTMPKSTVMPNLYHNVYTKCEPLVLIQTLVFQQVHQVCLCPGPPLLSPQPHHIHQTHLHYVAHQLNHHDPLFLEAHLNYQTQFLNEASLHHISTMIPISCTKHTTTTSCLYRETLVYHNYF